MRRLYSVRAQIEEGIRVCEDHLSLTGCQARSERAQLHYMICCLVAFCVLEWERCDHGVSIYKLKRRLSFTGHTLVLPALEQLRSAASPQRQGYPVPAQARALLRHARGVA